MPEHDEIDKTEHAFTHSVRRSSRFCINAGWLQPPPPSLPLYTAKSNKCVCMHTRTLFPLFICFLFLSVLTWVFNVENVLLYSLPSMFMHTLREIVFAGWLRWLGLVACFDFICIVWKHQNGPNARFVIMYTPSAQKERARARKRERNSEIEWMSQLGWKNNRNENAKSCSPLYYISFFFIR